MAAVDHGHVHSVQILTNQTSANGQPSGDDGISVNDLNAAGALPRSVSLQVYGTVTAATTGTVDLRLWVKSWPLGQWMPAGTGTGGIAAGAGVRGMLNQGQTVDEVVDGTLSLTEPLDLPGHFERIYIEVLNPANLTDLDAYLVWQPQVGGI